jgi:hypothetical protein
VQKQEADSENKTKQSAQEQTTNKTTKQDSTAGVS